MDAFKPVEVKADISPSANEQITNLFSPSSKQVGLALGNLFGLLNTATLPFKFFNTYAQHNFAKYEEKLKEIPTEQIKEVEPEIGIPVMEKLSYTKNEDLANAYTNLLANASRKDKVDIVHPGFISKINSMAPDEAKILELIKDKNDIEYIIFRAENEQGHFLDISVKITGLEKELGISPQQMQMHLENLISLSILYDNQDNFKIDEKAYDSLSELYSADKHIFEEQIASGRYSDLNKLSVKKSFFTVTSIGKTFIEACIKN